MHYHFSLFVIFSVGLLVLAAPVNKEEVKQGNIYWSRLRFVDHDSKPEHKSWKHPVVVLSDVDAQDQVKVALMSKHFTGLGPVEPASNYADLKGSTSISVGPPKTVNIKHLQLPTIDVNAVRPGRLQPLINSINANCSPDQRLADCEPSGSAPHNTEHGRPEHDNSKQGSQPGSPNKGSSSQSSRLGSTMQGGQKSTSNQGNQAGSSKQGSQAGSSKQGNQADSSKHGSRPRSPDDGWQVATSRRKNKASKSRNK